MRADPATPDVLLNLGFSLPPCSIVIGNSPHSRSDCSAPASRILVFSLSSGHLEAYHP